MVPHVLHIADITQLDARHVLYFRNKEHGFQPGSFTQAVLEAAWLADAESLNQLGMGFPGLIAAFIISKDEKGVAILEHIANDSLGDNVLSAATAIVNGDN